VDGQGLEPVLLERLCEPLGSLLRATENQRLLVLCAGTLIKYTRTRTAPPHTHNTHVRLKKTNLHERTALALQEIGEKCALPSIAHWEDQMLDWMQQ
jgi:hypothetical protein